MKLELTPREQIALIVAPLPAVLLYTGLLIYVFSYTLLGVDAYIWYILLAFLLGYAGMFFVGLPIIIFLKRNGDLSQITLTVFGAIGGMLYVPFAYYLATKGESDLSGMSMAVGAFYGTTVGVTFGLVAKVRFKNNAS